MVIKEQPLVSILLPVYNGELFIRESIESILQQTYTNWELLVVDDGSKDNSSTVIESFKDARIRFIRKNNTGLGDSLNQMLSFAKGELLARQDQDDISLPLRLEKQVEFMLKNPDVGLVGTWSKIINSSGKETGRFHKHPTGNIELKMDLFFDNPFVHSSVMLRKIVLTDCGLYNAELSSLAQDFEFWFRISGKYKVANIPEVLHEYLEIETSISRTIDDFSAKVAEQCSKNICSALPNENQDIIYNFAHFYHGSGKTTGQVNAALFKQFKNIIFSLEKVVTNGFIGTYSLKHIQLLKRKYYNHFIYSKHSSLPVKYFYKIKRRILLF